MDPSGYPTDLDSQSSLVDADLREYVREVMSWTEYQATAYITVVRHGPVEPSEIVAMTDIPQGRVYSVMDTLEGEAVNVQGRQPKRYEAQHPRSVLGDEQEAFNEKADIATDHLEQQHEIQRERHDPRHPAWVITGISGIKRELLDGLKDVEERVLLMEQDGKWIQSNQIRDLGRLANDGVEIEVIGTSRWTSTLEELATEAEIRTWRHEQLECSFSIFDDELIIMRVGRGDTGLKIEGEGPANIFRTAFKETKQEATKVL
jgi:sugar-specific transcriptional regulator TrmB